MAIADDLTFAKFGYTVESLKRRSRRLVVCRCDACADLFDREHRRCSPGVAFCPGCRWAPAVMQARMQKRDATMAKNGTAMVMTPEDRARRASTMIERYGTAGVRSTVEGDAKREATFIERFGGRPATNAAVREKMKRTTIERFGVANAMHNPDVVAKISATYKGRTGFSHPLKNPVVVNQMLDTRLERYGTVTVNAYGAAEQEVADYVASLGIDDVRHQLRLRTSKIVDIYVPSRGVAIEYNGLRWHHERSPQPRLRGYHRNKMMDAAAEGFRLITVFEDEWITRRTACQNVLRSAFGCCEKHIGARQCRLVEPDTVAVRALLDREHVQGAGRAPLFSVGLEDVDGALVGVMTFGAHHRQGQDALVLSRMVFAANTVVTGGASRMLQTGVRWARAQGYKTLVSWSDNRWFSGASYARMGFALDEELPADYIYVNVNRPVERISKQSQSKRASKCPPGLTELQWAEERGLARIWDCGRKRWTMAL